jgi:signal peptidase I
MLPARTSGPRSTLQRPFVQYLGPAELVVLRSTLQPRPAVPITCRVSQPPPAWSAAPDRALDGPPPLGQPVRRRYAVPLLLVVGLAVLAAVLILHDDVTYYRVTSGSMLPTLPIGSRVAAETGVPLGAGEIVVFRAPQGATPVKPVCAAQGEGEGFQQPCGLATPTASGLVLVKRIVAGPGDLVSMRAGRTVVNGIASAESFISPCARDTDCSFPVPVLVPAGEYFLLGDNRGDSDDSRFWGPVPAGWIAGVVVHCGPLQTLCRPLR